MKDQRQHQPLKFIITGMKLWIENDVTRLPMSQGGVANQVGAKSGPSFLTCLHSHGLSFLC